MLRGAVTTGLGRGGWGSYGIIRRWEGHGMEGQPMGYRDSPWDIGTLHGITRRSEPYGTQGQPMG